MRDYRDFIRSKHRRAESVGISVTDGLNPHLKDFQRDVVTWSLRKGRAALFEDCGLGKSLQELEWLSQLIERGHAKRGLLLCPVAVAPQMLREAAKFEIPTHCRVVKDSSEVTSGINITNYEKLHKFDCQAFDAVVLDESSILKSFAGKTKRALCDAFRDTRFKLAATATPAPNDHMELGNQCDWLGVMPSNEMLARWFINDTMKAGGYRLKGHAAADFWDWMASWAVSIRKPSDIGGSDEGYILPPLHLHEHVTESSPQEGQLFATGSKVSATNIHKEKRASLAGKAELIASLVNGNDESWACWVDTNYEADALRKLIPGSVEVRGSDTDGWKASKLEAFALGEVRVIVTKSEIAGFGLNWQHCCNTTYFAGFSFERWYQSIRRLYRFGQSRPVNCHMLSSENESDVVATLNRKQQDAESMSASMVEAMRVSMTAELRGATHLREYLASESMQVPNWITSKEDQCSSLIA